MAINYQISPGNTKYQDLLSQDFTSSSLEGAIKCDIVVIGGGFTGLSAAYNLAQSNIDVVLLEAGAIGAGASGRNGGQIGCGQRLFCDELERLYGADLTRDLLSIWFEARDYLFNLLSTQDIQLGHISAIHKSSLVTSYIQHMERMQFYGYDNFSWLGKSEICEKLGSKYYQAGLYDKMAGHINPLVLLRSLFQLSSDAGAKIFTNSPVINIEKQGHFIIKTLQGEVRAQRVLLAINGYYNIGLKSCNLADYFNDIKSRIFPIYSYIAASETLSEFYKEILPNNESVDDSRFAVRYFRKEKDHSLIFGGAETYYGAPLSSIRKKIKQQITEIYPQLANIKLDYGWGGRVAITRNRMPYIKELEPGLTYCGGYSGHGLALAPYIGKIYADSIIKGEISDSFRKLQALKNKPFIGGKYLRIPALFLALSYFAWLDKL